MDKEKADTLLLGIIFIVLTKVFDFSSIFLLVGLFFVFDAFFSTEKDESEDC